MSKETTPGLQEALLLMIEAIRLWEARGRKPENPTVTTMKKTELTKRKKKP
jgi:hypothetical protein